MDFAHSTLHPHPRDLYMRVMSRLGILALLLVAACTPRVKDRIALVGGNVIPGNGGSILRDAVVVVFNGKVETVAPREGFRPVRSCCHDESPERLIAAR